MTDRTYDPGRSYPCTVCKGSKPADSFYQYTRGGKRKLFPRCKSCSTAASLESKARRRVPKPVSDPRYDYRFARDILGFSRERATSWVCESYGMEPDELEARGGSFHMWQPDPYVAA